MSREQPYFSWRTKKTKNFRLPDVSRPTHHLVACCFHRVSLRRYSILCDKHTSVAKTGTSGLTSSSVSLWQWSVNSCEMATASMSVSPSPPDSRPETPCASLVSCPITLTALTPPDNYGVVERGTVYRSGFPRSTNIAFLEALNIQSMMYVRAEADISS